MKRILTVLGYREKTQNAPEEIRKACLLNAEMNGRIEELKATLNGEKFWFSKDAQNERNAE